MVFHFGMFLEQKSKMSVMRRIDGLGGKIYVPRAMYSLRMSFWIVPESAFIGTPCFSATAMYIERSTDAGALIVIEVETLSRGMPPKRISASARLSTATPTLPHSPTAMGSSES